jgi:glycosyltransferase involved in cell wall biosynthesis
VLYLGTCAYDKGTVHVVEGMRRIWSTPAAGEPASSADLVLAGPVLDPFRDYLNGLPAPDRARIHVRGYVSEDQKRDLLDAATLVAMPSRTDSFGIVYLEGWLYRKPVIGARAGGVPSIIDDQLDGFLVDFGDVTALSRRIAEIFGDPDLGRRLAERGYAKVLRHYTWDQIYPVVEEVYERLCPAIMAT